MSITVDDGTLIVKDPDATRVYQFDWDAEHLGASATITTSSFVTTAIEPSTTDSALTLTDSGTGLGIQGGSRKVNFKLAAGTLGQKYRVTNRIITNESPAQTIDKSIYVLVEHE